jgi:hypothetical protein
MAKHDLRRSRTVSGRVALRQGIAARLRGRTWRWPVALAVAVHLPLVLGLFEKRLPDWLGSAWLVSATMIGFGVALVVFLLQAASSQSLSSQATFGAVVVHTLIVWPASMALVFLMSVGVLERYGASSGEQVPWAETWALVLFVGQIAAFGLAFARTLKVVSPAGVAKILRITSSDAMTRAIEANLLKRLMTADLQRLCEDRVSYGRLFARGQLIAVDKPGQLSDVDRRLPREIDDLMMGELVTLTIDPGRLYRTNDAVARIDGQRSRWLEQVIRKAIVLQSRQPPPEALPVFNDVLDVARRAFTSGSHGNSRDSLRLVVDCLTELPRIYGRWGISYTSKDVHEPFVISTEYEVVRGLMGLSDDAFRSTPTEAVRLLPQVAAELVHEGLDQGASLLLEQGAALWLHQLRSTSILQSDDLRHGVHELIGLLCKEAVSLQQHTVEDPDRTLKEKSAAQTGLIELFRTQVRVFKLYIDTADERHFTEAWRYWAEWANYWEPQQEVEELELRTLADDVRQQRGAARALASARAALELKNELATERARLIFVLGSWALERYRRQKLTAEQWTRFVTLLTQGISGTKDVSQLLRSVYNEVTVEPLRNWQLQAWDGNKAQQPPDDRTVVRLWGVIVLLRTIEPSATAIDLELGPYAASLGADLIAGIEEVAQHSDWEEAAGGDLSARAQAARLVVERAIHEETARADNAVAQAPLDSARIHQYIDNQRQAYAKGDYLRELMLIAGAIEQTEGESSQQSSVQRTILPKSLFVNVDHPGVVIGSPRAVNALVQQQLQAAYAALAGSARPTDGAGATGAVEAIEDLRRAGHAPDVILIPGDPYVRPLLSQHNDWRWTSDFMQGTQYLATLADVPVYDPGPSDATALVVCSLGASMRRIEHRRPGDTSPLHIRIESINQSRAAELWDEGARAPGTEDDQDAQVAALVSGYVEMYLDMDVEWKAKAHSDSVCRRIELPPRDQRRPQTTTDDAE